MSTIANPLAWLDNPAEVGQPAETATVATRPPDAPATRPGHDSGGAAGPVEPPEPAPWADAEGLWLEAVETVADQLAGDPSVPQDLAAAVIEGCQAAVARWGCVPLGLSETRRRPKRHASGWP